MELFREFGLLPQVFDPNTHESPSVQRWVLHCIQQGLQDARFIRCFRDGAWAQEAARQARGSKVALEFLEFLKKRKILINASPCNEPDWVEEAFTSHRQRPLTGLIVDDRTKCGRPILPIAAVSSLPDTPWWMEKPPSTQTARTADSLVSTLRLLLVTAREIHLVDPFINPENNGFAAVLEKVFAATLTNPHKPELFIHTSLKVEEFNNRQSVIHAFRFFSQRLSCETRAGRVLVWNPRKVDGGFHDRYLLTDLAACQVGAGFQECRGQVTTVSVLTPESRLSLLKRFDPNPNSAVGQFWATRIGYPKNSMPYIRS
jgi:hypothetical protein